jgi:hypothetical protein
VEPANSQFAGVQTKVVEGAHFRPCNEESCDPGRTRETAIIEVRRIRRLFLRLRSRHDTIVIA